MGSGAAGAGSLDFLRNSHQVFIIFIFICYWISFSIDMFWIDVSIILICISVPSLAGYGAG